MLYSKCDSPNYNGLNYNFMVIIKKTKTMKEYWGKQFKIKVVNVDHKKVNVSTKIYSVWFGLCNPEVQCHVHKGSPIVPNTYY